MPRSDQIFKHVHQIMEQRDENLLSLTLLQSVNEMLNTSSCLLLTLNRDKEVVALVEVANGELMASAKRRDISPELHAMLAGMLERSEDSLRGVTIGRRHGSIDLVFKDEESYQLLVCLREKRFQKLELGILHGMFQVYGKFLSLLAESQTDELTRLANRKTFEAVVSHVFESEHQAPRDRCADNRRAPPSGRERVWLSMIDVDDFKRVNDEFGHLYGDEILIHLAKLIKECFRQEDYKFRFGGEEFVILHRARDEDICRTSLERFLGRVRDYRFPGSLGVTVSIGVVEFKRDVYWVTSLDQADQALYFSKQRGKDCVTFYERLVEQELIKPTSFTEGKLDFF